MNEKNKLLITIAVVVVVILGELVFLYLGMSTVGDPPFGGDKGLLAQITVQERAIALELARIDEIPGRTKERDSLLGEQRLATQLLPNLNEPEKYISFFYQVGRESGVKVIGITPQAPVSRAGAGMIGGGGSDKFDEWSFDMDLRGGFNEIAKFVNGMEQFRGPKQGRRFFAIKTLSITAENSGMNEQGVHRAKLTLKTYRYAIEEPK